MDRFAALAQPSLESVDGEPHDRAQPFGVERLVRIVMQLAAGEVERDVNLLAAARRIHAMEIDQVALEAGSQKRPEPRTATLVACEQVARERGLEERLRHVLGAVSIAGPPN